MHDVNSRTPGGDELSELRILVVDDDDDLRRGVQRLVGSIGASVDSASDGAGALAKIRRQAVDIVISDIRMPRMTGTELLEAIRESKPETAVVLMTGFGTIELAVACMEAGAAHFMAKPFDNRELLRTVRRIGRTILARRRHRDTGEVELIARDARMRDVVTKIDQVAGTRLPVLIEGETGTGKELVAREIHKRSAAAPRGFHAVNCAALPDSLLESELFGHRRGAFTGADNDREGLFAKAQGGTVFLDEISSMSPAFQAKLLRVLQNKVVRPLGADGDVEVSFRLLAATNRDLEAMAGEGEFRLDLLYRLRILNIRLPALRERRDDIGVLAEHFIAKLAPECRDSGAAIPTLSAGALARLRAHDWPGNVRELESAVTRALVSCPSEELRSHHFDLIGAPGDDSQSYDEGKKVAIERFQRRFVEHALAAHAGNVSHAADACGLTRAALQKIMRSLGITREDFLPN